MFPNSPLFSKILDNMKSDFSKISVNNNPVHPIQTNRAKSSLNRKNVYSTKYSLPEMKQINIIQEKNNVKNIRTSQTYNTNLYKTNIETNNYNNADPLLFSFSNNKEKNFANSYNNDSSNFNKTVKKNDKFNINNFKLSSDDFHYKNNFDNMNNVNKNNYNNFQNLISEKSHKNNNDSNVNYNELEKIDPEKLIHDYRLQLNKEILRRLYEEREKENIRDKLLNNARDYSERKKLEQRFIFERAQASAEIIQINE